MAARCKNSELTQAIEQIEWLLAELQREIAQLRDQLQLKQVARD